jgi:ABC-type multidrug transport system fused ATPase/permease subunit
VHGVLIATSYAATALHHCSPQRSRCVVQTDDERAVHVSYARLFRLVARNWPFIIAGCLASAVLGCVFPLFALFISSITAALTPREPERTANAWALGCFGLGFGMLALAGVQALSFAVLGADLAQRVREMFLRAALYMEVAWFDQARAALP